MVNATDDRVTGAGQGAEVGAAEVIGVRSDSDRCGYPAASASRPVLDVVEELRWVRVSVVDAVEVGGFGGERASGKGQ